MEHVHYSIGEAAQAAGLSIKAIRYYEEIGLVPSPRRRAGGHRMFTAADVARLQFISRARMLDLRLEDIRPLLAIRDAGRCPGTEPAYRRILDRHLDAIEERMAQLQELARQVRQLRSRAAGSSSCACQGCACLHPDDRLEATDAPR